MLRRLSSSFFALFLALSLALSAGATPVVQVRDNPVRRLQVAKKFNFTGSSTILARDQAHAKFLRDSANARRASGTPLSPDAIISGSASNQAVSYIATVGVGSPATEYDLIVDTGSSNTWIGAGRPFVQSGTTRQTRDKVSVTYGSGQFSGTEFIDTVTIAPGLVINGQSIGVAIESQGFDGVDGILGLGPTLLTQGTLDPDTYLTVPTVTDNAFSLGISTDNLVAISFEPTNTPEVVNGELTFGGTDSTKYTGAITFTPITSTYPAAAYFGIDQSITYGTSTELLSDAAGIIDTGTTLTLIASDAFRKYRRATGAVQDHNTGLLRLSAAKFANLQSLFFTINEVTFEFTPNAQIWPRALNKYIGGKADDVYLIVNNLGTHSGEGLDFINGQTWLERFYAVFDTTNSRIGFADTAFTRADTN